MKQKIQIYFVRYPKKNVVNIIETFFIAYKSIPGNNRTQGFTEVEK